MTPVEKGLGRSEGVVVSEGVVRFRIALGKSEESEVSVFTRIYALAMQKYQENEKPAESAPEPDGCNDAAIVTNTEEVSHVEQRLDRPSETTYPAAHESAYPRTHKTRRHDSLLERDQ
jgi:hypothetical protein